MIEWQCMGQHGKLEGQNEAFLYSFSHQSHHTPSTRLIRKIPLRRIPLLLPTPILPHMFLISPLIRLELLQFRRTHMLNHVIRLPLFKAKPHALMTIILVVCLILVIFNLHKLTIFRRGIQTQRDKSGDSGGLGDEPKSPGLLVFELDHVVVGADYLVGFVDGGVEEFGEGEPLPGHFIAVVGVDELVVVDAVGRVAFYAFDGGFAGVEGDDLGYCVSLCIWRRCGMRGYGLTSSTSAWRWGLSLMLLLGSGS